MTDLKQKLAEIKARADEAKNGDALLAYQLASDIPALLAVIDLLLGQRHAFAAACAEDNNVSPETFVESMKLLDTELLEILEGKK